MTKPDRCPLCDRIPQSQNIENGREKLVSNIDCQTCGQFEVSTGLIHNELKQNDIASRRHLLSAVTKSQRGRGAVVDSELIERVREERLPRRPSGRSSI